MLANDLFKAVVFTKEEGETREIFRTRIFTELKEVWQVLKGINLKDNWKVSIIRNDMVLEIRNANEI